MELEVEPFGIPDADCHAPRGRSHRCAPTGAWPSLPDDVVKSAGRVLQILEYFEQLQEPANLIMVCRALALPQSSALMLMRSLVALGYLQYDLKARTYQPTGRSALLGSWMEPLLAQEGPLLKVMRDLSDHAKMAAVLSARNHLNAQDIYIVDRRVDGREPLAVGTLRPITTSATGQMLLSALPDTEIAKIARRINASERAGTVVRLADLLKRIHEARQTGYLLAQGTEGAATLAMAVPDRLTRRPLVLTLIGPLEQITEARRPLMKLLSAGLRCVGPSAIHEPDDKLRAVSE